MMIIDAVILDFDGTLVDSEPIWKKAILSVFKEYGITVPVDLLHAGTGLGIDVTIPMTFEALNINDLDPEEIKKKIVDTAHKKIIEEAQIRNGFFELLELLNKLAIPLAVCTASPMEMLKPALDLREIKNSFKITHSCAGAKNMKPHPDPYLLTAKELEVDILRCLVVEDSIPGIISDITSGAKTFAIPSINDLEKAKKLDATIIKDFVDVTNYIQEHYEEK